MKKCINCGKGISGNLKKYCSTKCSGAYRYQKNKAIINPNTYHRQVMKYRYRKFKLIELRGNEGCARCGYKKNIGAIDLHHINPDLKEFRLDARNLSNRSWSSIIKEFEKCEILCANCHREEHNPELLFEESEEYLSLDLGETPKMKYLCACGKEITRGAKACKECDYKSRQICERPVIQELIEVVREIGFIKTGKKYGVSDNTIRKWIKNMGYDPKKI